MLLRANNIFANLKLLQQTCCHFKMLANSFSSSSDSEVLTEVKNHVGWITLNRPKALNALTLSMIRHLRPVLQEWNEGGVSLIVIKGAGNKAFCAGGDIRAITKEKGSPMQKAFFREEYGLDNLIGTFKVPFVAILNGITMGGGVGVSVNGRFRVGTESSVFAMPECGIGLVPDVGASHFLPRLKGELGMFLALTGFRLKGWDCLHAGITTHAVDHSAIESLEHDLQNLSAGAVTESTVQDLLDVHTAKSNFSTGTPFSLEPHLAKIDQIFSAGSVEEIMERLKTDGSDWAEKQVKTMSKMSPTSLKVAYRLVRDGAKLPNLAECLTMELRLVMRCCEDEDFYEGVRALLIDKDNSPKWSPPSLEKVTGDIVNRYFSHLPDGEEFTDK